MHRVLSRRDPGAHGRKDFLTIAKMSTRIRFREVLAQLARRIVHSGQLASLLGQELGRDLPSAGIASLITAAPASVELAIL